MTRTRTKTRNDRPLARALSVVGLDPVGGWSLVGSVGFHVALLSVALAAAAIGAREFRPGEARAPAGLSVPVVSTTDLQPLSTDMPQPAQAAPTQPSPAQMRQPNPSVMAPAALFDARDIPTDFAAPLAAPLVQASTPPDTGAMRSAPTVFGVSGQREAQRVVYIVDVSGSMVAALPVVLGEVARSIDALAPEQRFTVGVFGAGAVRAPTNLAPRGDTLIAATESNKAAVRRWLRTIEARGGGDALDALRWGLEQRPDILFVMAKGISDRGQNGAQRDAAAAQFLAELERLNPRDADTDYRPVRIRTIEFFDADAAHLLERIGVEHGEFGGASPGSGHRFISRREFGLE